MNAAGLLLKSELLGVDQARLGKLFPKAGFACEPLYLNSETNAIIVKVKEASNLFVELLMHWNSTCQRWHPSGLRFEQWVIESFH
jgi:hypothetical protein